MTFPALTYEDLIALFERILPRSYVTPIQNEGDGQGFDIFSQQARQFARAADAASITTQAYYLLPNSREVAPPAAGAQAATGELLVSRDVGSAIGAVTIPISTVFVATVESTTGSEVAIGEFRSTAEVTIPSGSLGPVTVPVESTRVGYQGNVAAGSVTSFKLLSEAVVTCEVSAAQPPNTLTDDGTPDRFVEAMLGRYVRFTVGPNVGALARQITAASLVGEVIVEGPNLAPGPGQVVEIPEWEGLGLRVSQPAPMTGGRHAWLDAIGFERGQVRAAGETDDEYRLRLNQLADVVSPGAIERIIRRTLGPDCVSWRFQEAGSPSLPGFFWDVSALDGGNWENGWLLAPSSPYFIVRVGPCNQGEFGFAFDADPFAPEDDNAWDESFFDGYPIGFLAVIAALWNALNAARAAGVQFWIVLDDTLPPCGTECC